MLLMDGQKLDFNSEFDAVFSHAALHWMRRDPDAVVQVGYLPRPVGSTGAYACLIAGQADS